MSEIYANAYQEVVEVLKYTKKEDLIKIPKFRIELYKRYMNKENNFKIDKNKPLKDQKLSNEAKAILANLYKDYRATDYEKQGIEAKENYDLEQIARERYNPDNLFNKKQTNINNISNKETDIMVIEEEKWYKKLFNTIKKLFNIKNPKNNRHNKLTKNEINQIEKDKSNGTEYAKRFDEEYSQMSDAEKKEVDNFMEELRAKIGNEDED